MLLDFVFLERMFHYVHQMVLELPDSWFGLLRYRMTGLSHWGRL